MVNREFVSAVNSGSWNRCKRGDRNVCSPDFFDMRSARRALAIRAFPIIDMAR